MLATTNRTDVQQLHDRGRGRSHDYKLDEVGGRGNHLSRKRVREQVRLLQPFF